jgi:hypothetical protein
MKDKKDEEQVTDLNYAHNRPMSSETVIAPTITNRGTCASRDIHVERLLTRISISLAPGAYAVLTIGAGSALLP